MNPLDVIRTAASSLGANKLRTILALLGIIIGVAAVVVMLSIGRGAQAQIEDSFAGLGTETLFVRPDFSSGLFESELSLDDAYALVDSGMAPSVVSVAPEVETAGEIVAGRESSSPQMLGVTPQFLEVRNYELRSGRFINGAHIQNVSQVAVLGPDLAETLFGFRDPVGQSVRINGRHHEVIGVLESRGDSGFGGDLDSYVLVPITTAYYRHRSFGGTASAGTIIVDVIHVKVAGVDVIDAAIEEIDTILRLRHRVVDTPEYQIISPQSFIEAVSESVQAFTIFMGSVAGISLFVGGIGIMNVMLVSVTERIREIGVRKAMGAKKRDILSQFVLEAVLLTLGGGAVGAAIGIGLSRLMSGVALAGEGSELTTVVTVDVIVLVMVVSISIGLFFGIYPAFRAAGLHPIEALRHE